MVSLHKHTVNTAYWTFLYSQYVQCITMHGWSILHSADELLFHKHFFIYVSNTGTKNSIVDLVGYKYYHCGIVEL